ncbi:DUF3810 domain-containing protein [Mariniphaga sediminis]|uniref:DUF3810 domain-containing protein n=1 Tax=Mariniphaga sediminis TaxID=1628158 RepID=UPI00356577F2
MKTKHFNIKRWLFLPVTALLFFGLTQILAHNPEFVERYYSQMLYPVVASCLSFLSKWLPFSLDDVFYILLILSFIFGTVLLILRKISFSQSAKILLNVLAAVYISFYLFWGFNYFRTDLNNRLTMKEQQAETEAFVSVFTELVEKTNASWCSFHNMDEQELARFIEHSYEKLAPALQLNTLSGKQNAKKITFSHFFAQAGISGYFGPFFNEVHVNRFNLPVEYPFVLAHEKAHQYGITGEAEANFYSWLVCSQSPSEHLQYSANLAILRYFIYHGRRLEQFPEIVGKLDERVKDDFRKIQKHWSELRNEKIDRAASKVNDVYLKTNNVEKGVQDYTGVVKHVMDFSLDTAFQQKLVSVSD